MADAWQANLNARMRSWTDHDIRRFLFRVELFVERGLPEARAERTADGLALRDQDHDSRRLCIECSHFVRGWKCRRGQAVCMQLMRCEFFNFQTPR